MKKIYRKMILVLIATMAVMSLSGCMVVGYDDVTIGINKEVPLSNQDHIYVRYSDGTSIQAVDQASDDVTNSVYNADTDTGKFIVATYLSDGDVSWMPFWTGGDYNINSGNYVESSWGKPKIAASYVTLNGISLVNAETKPNYYNVTLDVYGAQDQKVDGNTEVFGHVKLGYYPSVKFIEENDVINTADYAEGLSNLTTEGSVTFTVYSESSDLDSMHLEFFSGAKELTVGKEVVPPTDPDPITPTPISTVPVVTASPTPAPVSTVPVATASPTPAPTEVQIKASATKDTEGEIAGAVKFNIPAGALVADSTINATVLPDSEAPSTGSLQFVSPVIEFTNSSGTTFDKPLELTFNYKVDQVPMGQKIAVHYYNEQQQKWIYIGGTVNSDGTVTIEVSHFTKFAVLAVKSTDFSDLSGHWAAKFTDRLIGLGVIQGFPDLKFHPEVAVTRAQFVKILAGSLGLKSSAASSQFADDALIPAWAKADVAAAVEAGLIHGIEVNGKTSFKANQTIARSEMAVILNQVLTKYSIKIEAKENTFLDAASIPDWAKAAVSNVASVQIIDGYDDGTFHPTDSMTRAEASAIIFKLLDALKI
jgi:hypothetical protein